MASTRNRYQHLTTANAITRAHDANLKDLLIGGYLTISSPRLIGAHRDPLKLSMLIHPLTIRSTVDRLIEPQTIAEFCSFCFHGILPNGQKTTLKLPDVDDLMFLFVPHTDPAENTPTIERMQAVIASDPDGNRLCDLSKNLHSIKNRAYSGIVPLSEQRWKEKGFDSPENFDIATQYLSAVVATFEYLNRPPVVENMRETFNLISEIWGEVDTIVNGARRGRGERTTVSVRALWTAYMKAHFEVMTERAHRWVLVHVNRLRAPLLRELASYRPANVNILDQEQWRITDRLHILAEVVGVADYAIMIPMHGYHGYTTPAVPTGVPAALRSPEFQKRHKAYGPYLKTVCRVAQAKDILDRRQRDGPSEHHVADSVSLSRTTLLQIDCQGKVRREMRGEPIEPMPKEPWIMNDLARVETDASQDMKGYGFVIYRLTYGQSDQEWTAFREKVEAHISDWGRGQTGSTALKPHLKLHWRDGKDLGIPEDDLEAAKEHYNSTYSESQSDLPFTLVDHINKRAFLAVDTASYISYTGSAYSAATDLVLKGDFTGFVVAIHAEYDPKEGPERPTESPAYSGHMRILGSLVWGDLYGMLSSQCAIIEDLWPLAMEHPNHVYVGPVVPLVMKGWRIQNGIRGTLMRDMANYAKAKVEGKQWAGPSIPSPAQPQAQSQTSNPSPASIQIPPHILGDGSNPDEYAARTWIVFQYIRWLRGRGRHREAILVEQVMRAPQGQGPDMDAVARQMELQGLRFDEQDFPSSPSGSLNTPPPSNPAPPASSDPLDLGLRAWMLTDFAQYARERGARQIAIFAEQLLRTSPGQRPDMDAIRRQMEQEGVLNQPDPPPPGHGSDGGRRDYGQGGDGGYDGPPDCPMQ